MTNTKEIKEITSRLTYLEKLVDRCHPDVIKVAYNSGKMMEDILRRKDALSHSERTALINRATNIIDKFENNCSCTVKEK